jgi:N-acyl-D-aspartate/D-glutamate deacylase
MRKYDILIKNTSIIDGTGAPPYTGSIGINGERIVEVGNIKGEAEKVIDGTGLTTCPGFIDPHSHADRSIIKDPYASNLIKQGITTFAGGQCGSSPAPAKNKEYALGFIQNTDIESKNLWQTFEEFLDFVESNRLTPNYIPLVGHGTIRRNVLGKHYARKSNPEELAEIVNMVEESFESGVFGLSVGLDAGMPGHFADIKELVDVVKIVKKYDGIFTPHTRHHQNQWHADKPFEYGYGIFNSPPGEIITGRYHGLLEAVEISKMAGSPKLHIAHITPAYLIPQPHPLSLDEALAKATIEDIISKAETEGVDISYNVIPSENSIGGRQRIIDTFFLKTSNLPKWLRDIDPETLSKELKNKSFRAKVKDYIYSGNMKFFMVHPLTDPYWADDYMILDCKIKEYEGKTLWEIVKQKGLTYTIKGVYEDTYELLFDIISEDIEATWTLVKDKREYGAYHIFLSHNLGIPCTDYVPPPVVKRDKKERSTSNYGISPMLSNMFIKYFKVMVKDKSLLSLEEAVRKVTSFPAEHLFGIKDRGIIKEGAFADILLIDFDNLILPNDYKNPEISSPSVKYVIINGGISYENGLLTELKKGKVLRKRSKNNG